MYNYIFRSLDPPRAGCVRKRLARARAQAPAWHGHRQSNNADIDNNDNNSTHNSNDNNNNENNGRGRRHARPSARANDRRGVCISFVNYILIICVYSIIYQL